MRGRSDPRDDGQWQDAREDLRRPRSSEARSRETRGAPLPSLDSLDDRRDQVSAGRSTYRLRASDVHLLRTLGTFRAVDERDLAPDYPTLHADVRVLRDQGLVTRVSTHTEGARRRADLLTLTRAGRDLLRANDGHDQRYYAGVGKDRELEHDAQLYRVYRAHVEHLRARDAQVERVQLDHELKRALWQRQHATLATADRAAALGLPVDAHGRVHLPDLQLVVREADGGVTRCNVEYVTRHYTAAAVRAKVAAGFVVYRDAPARGGWHEDRERRLVSL